MVIRLFSLEKMLDIFNMQYFVKYSIIFKYVQIYFSELQKRTLLLDLVNTISKFITRHERLTT